MAFTKRRVAARRRRPGSTASASRRAITIRDAATLEADRSSDRAGRLRRRVRRFLLCATSVSRSRRTAARSSPRPRTVSSRGGISGAARRRRRLKIEHGSACARAQPGRSHRGGRHRRAESSSSTCAPEPCERRPAARREPELAAVQPGRRDRRVDEPRRDGDSLGRRVGDTPRDAARPLELRSAARLQPRRGDALHGESRRHGDRLGPRRATAGSGGRSRSRTTGRSPRPGLTATRGSSAPTAG